MIHLSLKDKLQVELARHFETKLKVDKRIEVRRDIDMFNFKEDMYVWAQKRDKIPQYVSIYFDNVYICGFDEEMPFERMMLEFWKGFKEAYTKKQISLVPPDMRVEDRTKKTDDLAAEIEKIKPQTKEQEIAKKSALKLAKGGTK